MEMGGGGGQIGEVRSPAQRRWCAGWMGKKLKHLAFKRETDKRGAFNFQVISFFPRLLAFFSISSVTQKVWDSSGSRVRSPAAAVRVEPKAQHAR